MLGIGKDVDFFELNKIVFSFRNVFIVDFYEDLDDKFEDVK